MILRFKELDEVVEFGIYKESKLTIIQLIKKDPKYVAWCLRNFKGFWLRKKLRIALDESLAQLTIKNRLSTKKLAEQGVPITIKDDRAGTNTPIE